MNLLGNLIWIIFGGFLVALEYFVAGVLLMLTIVGIPFGMQSFKLAHLALIPFGREAVYTEGAPGCLSTVMNIIWILIGGIWIALTHLAFGLLFAITIIGIPFARQHFKLMSLSFTPFGREVRRK
ncbi:MAG: YccF domain-containing protein [Bacteroidales bacterium]|nr:YccF domain-containing protein [Bacteroidales bacterium]MCF8458395.1 YccF domain-containing protein [Bacteroidales bacterium]